MWRQLMPGAMSNNPYYDNDDLPDDMRKIIQKYEYETKMNMPNDIILPKKQLEEDLAKKTVEEYERQMKKLLGSSQTNISEAEQVRRKIQPQLDEIQEGMRKIGILLDSDLPDEESFKKFKMLREAYRKYKMIEALVLGQDND